MINESKNIPKTNFNVCSGENLTNDDPAKVNATLGNPKIRRTFRSRPCLKNVNLPTLPEMWRIAVVIKAVGKSKKKSVTGKKSVEEPNPAIVPTTTEEKAATQNNNSAISISYQELRFSHIGHSLHKE